MSRGTVSRVAARKDLFGQMGVVCVYDYLKSIRVLFIHYNNPHTPFKVLSHISRTQQNEKTVVIREVNIGTGTSEYNCTGRVFGLRTQINKYELVNTSDSVIVLTNESTCERWICLHFLALFSNTHSGINYKHDSTQSDNVIMLKSISFMLYFFLTLNTDVK